MVTGWLKWAFTLIVWAVLACSTTAMAAVTAHVDRFNISENETVNLTIDITGDDSGDPDTAPLLKDFEILSNNHSSSYSIINGSTSSKSTWSMMLRPRHTGALTIPAMAVGSTSTRPIMLQVSKIKARTSSAGHPTGDVWLSMEIAPKSLRVQQQSIITIRVYQSVGLNQAQLSEPKAEHAIVERLGKDSTYQKRDSGRTWQVTERHYALFPQQSGHLAIEPLQLDGTAMMNSASYFQSARPIRVRSNALELDVAGIPAGWTAADWLPAKNLTIEESWPQVNSVFTVGEPITRTLTLHADGLTASQLPEFSHDLPDHLKAYDDKPVLKNDKAADGIHGMRQEKVAIMPMQVGTYILPEIDINWWDTATETMQQATLPARTFTVIAAAGQTTLSASPLPVPTTEPQHPVIPQQANTTPLSSSMVAAWWRWLAIASIIGWLLTLVSIWYLRRQNSGPKEKRGSDSAQAAALKQARKALANACKNNDAKASEQALLHIAQLQFSDQAIHSLTTLAQYCNTALQPEVIKLEQILYGTAASAWHGDTLWHAFQQAKGFVSPHHAHADKADALPGLYPD